MNEVSWSLGLAPLPVQQKEITESDWTDDDHKIEWLQWNVTTCLHGSFQPGLKFQPIYPR